jgi:glycerol uptake facilitator-like aquaporin
MDVMEVADSVGNQKVQDDLKIQQVIDEQLLRDKSPEAKMGRRKMLIRAAYGEFMCSLFFYAPIFCTLANAKQSHWSNDQTTLSSALVAGFQAIGISFAFSSMSGAQFNSAISFALWLTGKLSNRRCLLYICVQLLASIMGMVMVTFLFTGDQAMRKI